jgi:hypothetical protein
LCGIRIALLQIVSTSNAANDQEQFKVCGTCLKEYIDQEAAAKKWHLPSVSRGLYGILVLNNNNNK